MVSHSRRDFLARSTAAAGLLALHPGRLLAAETVKPPAMSIARWTGTTPPRSRTWPDGWSRRRWKALGGMRRFVSAGSVVWVKPNIAWDRTPEQAANTNPELVAAVVKMCFEAGAKVVKVGDNPCQQAPKTYQNSGIAPAVRPLGAKIVFLDPSRFRETAIGGEAIRSIPVYPEMLDCDLLINIPIVKHHKLADATMCMKNYLVRS